MSITITDNSTVLFQGDSITDYGRKREPPDDMGVGFAMMASAWFSAMYPQKNVKFINRGIGGNRVQDLRNRWQTDCLDLKPTLVSVLIGINDTWTSEPTPIEQFESAYRDILLQVKQSLNSGLILCEPFIIPVPGVEKGWGVGLDEKAGVVKKLADEFGALHIPLGSYFKQACTRREPGFWAADGIHPTPAGNAVIAKAWLEAVKAV